ncbi:DJ-1/PfpI family protein [Allosphingosinicella flava]|uniref:DJ-1/PfpI family protein n=1 Tax=Allosphingosinicella flava TaxID=2771430 RepID=A0A7T2GKD1_9SPHN|nr:DJ-1/PfpI family protein [Sphingosinicella flava]QPQ55461.1 DJ-1/PfpI family protein [Sphingosinicella flava]
MNRREIMKFGAAGTAIAILAGGKVLASSKSIKVAFMIGPNANVIDTAGPWEVFQDYAPSTAGSLGMPASPFEIYTVGPSHDPVTMTGGLVVVPHYSHADAPQPNVIIVPAMRPTESGDRWLKQASAKADITASICTGAFHLARAGLFDGLAATTHHEFYDSFSRQFPNVDLRKGRRFVDSGKIMSAGGLTSGIDLALHVVARYFNESEAAGLAAWLEHDSEGWRTGIRA